MFEDTFAIETTNLTKTFNGYKAVDRLALRVPAGSIYGFLGPNGAGKTTTIKMLTGLSKPTEGDMKICGREVSFGSLKSRNDIGYLPDVPAFYDWMRADEFLKFSGELFDINRKVLKNRIGELMELVGLKGVNKKIGGYSRGMKQRLGIAQALISDPKVVFLDEPTSALDPIGRKEVMDIIQKLSGRVTVFFSTHILSDVERVCDRVVIMNKGKMVVEDTLEELKEKYSTRAILLEIEDVYNLDKVRGAFAQKRWLKHMECSNEGEIKVFVENMKAAQKDIPAILFENNALLKKFSILEPSLEDIFIRVVND